MTTSGPHNWLDDFGLDSRNPPDFYLSVEQLEDSAKKSPQIHALRRAFEDKKLEINGVLCQDHSPVIYFRQVEKIDVAEITRLHTAFWNQGIAPILVIIAPDEVHIYSGLATPANISSSSGESPALIEILDRVQVKLRSFLLSVETGEYFHSKRKYFNPRNRVDRALLRNLEATRQNLGEVQVSRLGAQTLDALLCRLVFTCYLFDRGAIDGDYLELLGIRDAKHMRDILSKKPRTDAKNELYSLFAQLGKDFNGDLFVADLEAESRQIKADHIEILALFFRGSDVRSGQQSFWPYDFSFIPIETISAIYEHFLKAAGEEHKKETGAFYTPRFLAEFVLDLALEGETALLDRKFLDPACGSGIFLVGLFNRLAEEWKHENSGAQYDRQAKGLMDILRHNIFGIDCNRSACQITAFSLYLAFLDQLSPPDIRKLLGKWERLPYLVSSPNEPHTQFHTGTIQCADFFTVAALPPQQVDIIVGNPPWRKATNQHAPAMKWCDDNGLSLPGGQLASAFVWKAPDHLIEGGKVCFVLPHGTLFNHNKNAVRFQYGFFSKHTVDRIINLTDYQFFLFEESKAPALVIQYRNETPSSSQVVEYWSPKSDWAVMQAEIIGILPEDRSRITVKQILEDLCGEDAPLIWKERYWATNRDIRLLDRLRLFPRLRGILGQRGKGIKKRWIIAEGFEPFGENDSSETKRQVKLTNAAKIEAGTHSLNLVLLPEDCKVRKTLKLNLRRGISDLSIFKKPLVLVTEGFSNVAFANFDVAYRHGIRGIHGPARDSKHLAFLAFYLRSSLAKFFLFHTSASWGVSRSRIDIDDLMRLPFPFPEDTLDPRRANEILLEIDHLMTKTTKAVANGTLGREEIIKEAQVRADVLINEYFDIDESEQMLIHNTVSLIIPSVRPTRGKSQIPTLKQSSDSLQESYISFLCNKLSEWGKPDQMVHGVVIANSSLGIGLIILEKKRRRDPATDLNAIADGVLEGIERLRKTAGKQYGMFEIVRGVKAFHKNLLFITKPLGQRFWTNAAALNDADELAAAILSRPGRGK